LNTLTSKCHFGSHSQFSIYNMVTAANRVSQNLIFIT
jgi:hypothetical protein